MPILRNVSLERRRILLGYYRIYRDGTFIEIGGKERRAKKNEKIAIGEILRYHLRMSIIF